MPKSCPPSPNTPLGEKTSATTGGHSHGAFSFIQNSTATNSTSDASSSSSPAPDHTSSMSSVGLERASPDSAPGSNNATPRESSLFSILPSLNGPLAVAGRSPLPTFPGRPYRSASIGSIKIAHQRDPSGGSGGGSAGASLDGASVHGGGSVKAGSAYPNLRLRSLPGDTAEREQQENNARFWEALSSDHQFFTLDLKQMNCWEFNALTFDSQTTQMYAAKMFSELGLVKRFSISPARLFSFLQRVDRAYKTNRYHNFAHAVDVLHCNYMLLHATRLLHIGSIGLRSVDALGFLFSAICHDIGHSGTNNNFEINTRSDLALLYNDQSVLENMHCALAFQLIRQQECNITENLTPQEWMEFRKVVIGCILATDMTHHFAMVARLGPMFSRLETLTTAAAKPFATPGEPGSEHSSIVSLNPAPKAQPADIKELLNALIHFADISNPTKAWEMSKEWSDRVTDEFYAQGDLEKKLSLPVSPMMDRVTGNQALTSANFIDFVVGPLLLHIVRFFPVLTPLAQNMIHNRERWESKLNSDFTERPDDTDEKKTEKEKQRTTMIERQQKFKAEFIDPVTALKPPKPQETRRGSLGSVKGGSRASSTATGREAHGHHPPTKSPEMGKDAPVHPP